MKANCVAGNLKVKDSDKQDKICTENFLITFSEKCYVNVKFFIT